MDAERSFELMAFKLFGHQYRNNRHYRRLCDGEHVSPETLRSWRDIPAMPAEAFKAFTLTTFPVKKAVRVFRTSGTTGEKRGAHYFETLSLYDSLSMPVFAEYLLPDKAKLSYFFLVESPARAKDSSLSYMMGLVNRHFGGGRGNYYVERGRLLSDRLIRDLKAANGPVFILSTVFSLAAILDELKKKNVRLKSRKGSRLMETGGFKGRIKEVSKAALYAACERYLGIPRGRCAGEYGMTELTGQFYETTLIRPGKKPVFQGPPWMRTMIIDPATGHAVKKGRTGLLRIFDLTNVGSVMAVQTQDLARETGGGFILLGRAPRSELRGCSLSYERLLRL